MQKLIIANWKSEKSVADARDWMEKYFQMAPETSAEIVIAPPMPLVSVVVAELVNRNLALAVQDLSPYPAGSYTGAVSSHNLNGLNVKYALVGHSERRRYFHETHQDVARKVEQAVANGITPVVCVDKKYLDTQASAIESNLLSKCVVAYEPLDAIGSGNNEDVGNVKGMVKKIRGVFGDVKVLYGGSVNQSNVQEYLLVTDGVLVGSASLDVQEFIALVKKSHVS